MNHTSLLSALASAKAAHTIKGLAGNAASTLLLITPHEADHCAVREIFRDSAWTVHYAYTWEEAQECLEENPASVVICDRDLPDGAWRNVLKGLVNTPGSPLLIVASRVADEHFWAEVLNLGGYDVILKPFEPSETRWTAGTAAWKWHQQHHQSHLVC